MRVVAGNWKAHRSTAEAEALCVALAEALQPGIGGVQVVICPPFTALHVARHRLPAEIHVGAQDVFWEDAGAFTGEVTPPMLTGLGCSHVIVGHSERRQHFGETDHTVSRKLQACWRHRLTPILCVGETLQEREQGHTIAVLRRQVHGALNGTVPAPLCVAYEPVWAIGTGKAARPSDCSEGLATLRGELQGLWGAAARSVPHLYGGSVNAGNCAPLWNEGGADGALVGGASLEASVFAAICRSAGEGV